MLSLMWVFGISIGNHHFRQRQPIEYRPNSSLIIISDIVQHNPLLIIESHMNVPVLPADGPALDLKRHAFRLCDIDRLDIRPVAGLGLDTGWVVVIGLCLVHRSAHIWDIDMDDLLLIEVEDRAEVKRE